MSEPPPNKRPHVVIAGGGFGGLTAARELGRAPVDVTVVDRTNHHLFQPLLYQVATAALSPAHIAAPIRDVLRNQTNTEVLMAEITGVDAESRIIRTTEREFPYDYLVLATGAHYNYFGHPEWEEFAPSLKTLEDALGIRHRILLAFEQAEMEPDPDRQQALLTFILVGGGPTGVEMAGSMAELSRMALKRDFRHIQPEKARIILMEASSEILSMFPAHLSAAARRALERLGVEVRLNAPVERVDADGIIVDGERIYSETVIWTAGTVASPVGNWLGVPTDRHGRVIVNPDLSVPGRPEVFVIGDCAHVVHEGDPLPGIAPVAMQQGKFVGRLIRARVEARPFDRPFRYWDKGILATVGRAFAIMNVGKFTLAGFLAWLLWIFIHIWYLIGFRNRIAVMFQFAWAYFTFQRTARLIARVQGLGYRAQGTGRSSDSVDPEP